MVDAWTRTPLPQEFPATSAPGDGVGMLLARLKGMAQDLREVTSNLLSSAGIKLTTLGMTISSSLTVDGNLASTGSANFAGPTTVGGSLGVTGPLTVAGTTDITGTTHIGGATDIDGTLNVDASATFGGAVAITGELTLNPGAIGNDALTNPIVFASTWGYEAGFGISTTGTARAECTYTIPAGFTRMAFTVIGTVQARNSSGGTQYIYVGPYRRTGGVVNGGSRQTLALVDGFTGTISAPYIYSTDVTPGDVITFYLDVFASAAIAAHALNSARIEVALSLTR